ncbi:translation initiation factor IF-2-like [Aquila chrysaetos chrysaetos]|uniref:translation initiation factor IF-2-like n=1 Tax=Aquila chrysaetos chrysaetos TaxID=223781 RepID=UPI001176C9A6|nr:translation initiation factor IF-2-like [Aquila chrysaetos chrysaetos]
MRAAGREESLFPFPAAGHHGGRSVGHHGGRASRGLDPFQLPEARLGAASPSAPLRSRPPEAAAGPGQAPADPPSPLPAAGGERRGRVRRPRYLLRAEIPAQVAGSGHGARGPALAPAERGGFARPGLPGREPPGRPRGAGERELMSVPRPRSRAKASSFPASHGGAGARAAERGRAAGRARWLAQRR